MWCRGWTRVSCVFAVVLAAARVVGGEDVNIDTVVYFAPYATKWDLRGSADGGCGVAGCDPRLTVDGHDNTVAESRWSCQPSVVSENEDCILYFLFNEAVTVSYLMLYFHESDDDTTDAIPFKINACSYSSILSCTYAWDLVGSFETVPGTALGSGQRVNLLNPTCRTMQVAFTLTSTQWVGVNEVDIFVDVSSTDNYELARAAERAIFEAGDITTVTPLATKWNVESSDNGGCGVGGCEPELTRDGDDNTVGDSRWSCETGLVGESETCSLFFLLSDRLTLSYLTLYFHEIDNTTATATPFKVYACYYTTTSSCTYAWDIMATDETRPGTELGVGQRVNLPRPYAAVLYIYFALAAGQVIGVNEVDIFVTRYGEDIPINIAAVTPAPQSISTTSSIPEPVEATSSATTLAPDTRSTPAPVEETSAFVTVAPTATIVDTPTPTADLPATPAPTAIIADIEDTPASTAPLPNTPAPTALLPNSPAPVMDTPVPATALLPNSPAPVMDTPVPANNTPAPTPETFGTLRTPPPENSTPPPTPETFGTLRTPPPVDISTDSSTLSPQAPATVADSGAFGQRAENGVTSMVVAVISAAVSLAFLR